MAGKGRPTLSFLDTCLARKINFDDDRLGKLPGPPNLAIGPCAPIEQRFIKAVAKAARLKVDEMLLLGQALLLVLAGASLLGAVDNHLADGVLQVVVKRSLRPAGHGERAQSWVVERAHELNHVAPERSKLIVIEREFLLCLRLALKLKLNLGKLAFGNVGGANGGKGGALVSC